MQRQKAAQAVLLPLLKGQLCACMCMQAACYHAVKDCEHEFMQAGGQSHVCR